MGKNTISTPDWMIKHTKGMREIMEKISDIDPKIVNEYREHTALKLMCVGYWSDVFTTIMDRHKIPTILIDICAGSGLTRVKHTDRFLPGSTFVADAYAHRQYKHIICVEADRGRARSLEKRLARIRSNESFTVISGKAEDNVERIFSLAKSKRGKIFAFVDPEGTDGLTWELIDRIGDLEGDILITWHEFGIERIFKASKKIDGDIRKLDLIFGNDSWKDATSAEDLTNRYITRLKRKRDIVRSINIRDASKVVYKQLLCVRRTTGGSPWLDAFDKDLRNHLEQKDAELIGMWLQIAYGEQTRLDNFK